MEISSPPRSAPGSPERPGLIARLQREGADWFLPSVLAPYMLTRAALVGAAEVATLAIPHATAQGPAAPPLTASWTAPFLGWDAYWYLRIAAEWYSYQPQAPPTEQQSVVFFPLYPLLVRAFSVIVGGADALPFAALVVANLGAIVGLTLLFRLVEGEFGRAIAQRTIWYFLIFPVSFFLASAYAEPIFLAACVIAMFAARSNCWLVAGTAGAAAALARPYGVLIVVPLGVEYVRQRLEGTRQVISPSALALVLPVAALLGWMVYLNALTGDPLVFVHGQTSWGRDITSPLDALLTGYGRTRDQQLQGRMDLGSLEFGIALLAAAASIITWRVLPVAYAAFATVFCLIALSGGSTVSVWRHVYLIFPIFMLAARGGAASLLFDRTYVALSLILAGLFITLRATGWAMVA